MGSIAIFNLIVMAACVAMRPLMVTCVLVAKDANHNLRQSQGDLHKVSHAAAASTETYVEHDSGAVVLEMRLSFAC